jgi:hypothetical protein
MIQPPPPLGTDWKVWGERLTAFLSTTRDKLRSLTSGESASDDGILMWDRIDKNPVVSIDGEWIPLGLGGGTNSGSHAYIYSTTSQTASVINTAYGITWNNIGANNNISINGSDSTRIDFAKGGTFYINFHATLASSNASTKTVYFFPKINGTTQDHSTIITTLHENGQKKIASRNGLFTVSAGDYLQAMWATDDVASWLENNTATSFAPSTPSVTLSIVEATT